MTADRAESWRAFTRRSYNRGARDFYVARAQARIVALLTSTLLPGSGFPRRHFRIIVHPDERRQGIATILLRRVEGQEPVNGVVLQCNFLHATVGARARIHSLVVASDCRGQGLARALMNHAIGALGQDGASGFTLGVRAENAPALGLYRKLGFEIVEEEETWQRTAP